MKFICTQNNLLVGLNKVSHIAGRNSTLPILSNILLQTTQFGLELVATNLEVAIKTTVRGKIEQEGAITVQGKLLLDWVNLTPGEKIELEVTNNNLTLTSEKRKAMMCGLPPDDFPVIPEVQEGLVFTINSKDLIRCLNQVLPAINPDESRPEISGILWLIKNNKLYIVGTDSYRLAEAQIGLEKTKDIQIIIPPRTIQELVRINNDKQEQIKIAINDNQILLEIGETKITSRLISGQYPDYQQIVPQQFTVSLVAEKEELIQAVKASSLFARSGINDIKLIYDSDKKNIVIYATNSQVGESSTDLALVKAEGEGMQIVFNYRYLLDGLQTINTERVVLKMNSTNSPAALYPFEQPGYFYIIMPIRQ